MSRPELGSKHECAACDAKFYDMGRPSAVCPKCGTDQGEYAKARAREEAAAEADEELLDGVETDEEDDDEEIDLDDEDLLDDDEDEDLLDDEDEDDD